MWTARSLRAAGRYLLPPLLGGLALAAAGKRRAAAAVLAAAGGVALFFRDPRRFPDPCLPGVVYAVTDGKVVLVRDGVHVPWLPGGPYRQVSVFLSLADVHVAWSPVSGTMLSWTRQDGKCRVAMLRAAEEENRQGRIVIETETGGDIIGVVLAAGLIARRITQWALPGAVVLGRRLGIIHFGSRSIMYIPEDRYQLLVGKDDRVSAGRSPVARRPAPRAGVLPGSCRGPWPCRTLQWSGSHHAAPVASRPAAAHLVAEAPRAVRDNALDLSEDDGHREIQDHCRGLS